MILTHKPVPHAPSQGFGSNATGGVIGDWNGTVVQQLVAQFGNYQPVGHLAIDFPCPAGTPIVAAAAGTVVYAGPGQHMPAAIAAKFGYIYGPGGDASGNITIIDHGDGSATAYSHQSEVQVVASQWVNGGHQIGLSGATGRITGAHLHFEYMTLPINYGSPYYSRSDPMAQYGATSILPVGAITQEEDDMALSEEDRKLMQAMHDVTREFLAKATQAQHDVTRSHLINVTQKQHDVTRAHVINSVTGATQAQEDVTRRYLSDRITEGAKPSEVADSVIAALGTDLAKQVADELGNRLAPKEA